MVNFWKMTVEDLKDKIKKIEQENERLHKLIEIKDNALKGADIKIKVLERENRELKDKLKD